MKQTLAAICLLTPLGAQALGVGEIKLQSALNQKLHAEIPLISTGAEDTSNIRIKLASPSAFAKAGIERFYFLNSLRFKPVVKPDGSLMVEVSSEEVIREPFLNFLVEVQWPNGRMLREFTVLLDPPATLAGNQAPIQSATGTLAQKPVSVAPAAPKPKKTGAVSGTRTAVADATPSKKKPRVSPEVVDAAAVRAPVSGDQYGPVSKRDSIWKIARKVNPNPQLVTHEQMMMALYRNNPQAFYAKNMSALKSGETLTIPDQQTIMAIDRREARTHFAKQSQSWSRQTGKLAALADAGKPGTRQQSSKQGASASDSRLEILSASKKPVSGGAKIQGRSAFSAEDRETLIQENEELRSRVADLENQVQTVQRLLQLKDQQLAALQAGQSGTQLTPAEPLSEQGENAEPETFQQASGEETSTEKYGLVTTEPPVVAMSNLDLGKEPESADASEQQSLLAESGEPSGAEQPDAETEPFSVITAPVSTETQTPATDQPDRSAIESEPATPASESVSVVESTANDNPSESEGFLTDWFSEPFYLAIGGAGALLLGLLAFAISRRRAGEEAEEPADIITSPDDDDSLGQSLIDVPIAPEAAADQEETFLSELTGGGGIDLDSEQDDSDPLAEVDVYMAYGRHQQAEDLIKSALKQDPQNEEYKVKLLETYAAADNQVAFDDYARQLHAEQPDPGFWDRVAAIGTAFSPQNPLFGGAPADDFAVDPETDDLLKGESGAAEIDLSKAYGDLDWDMEDDENPVDPVSSENDAETGQEVFDDALQDALGSTEVEIDSSLEQPSEMDEGLDFDAALLGESLVQPGPGAKTLVSDTVSDLGEIDFDLEALDPLSSNDESSVLMGVSDEFPELTDMDEVETKLDLAKAYVDMEDKESAREILDDVLGKGSEAQKQEAELLIKKLASN